MKKTILTMLVLMSILNISNCTPKKKKGGILDKLIPLALLGGGTGSNTGGGTDGNSTPTVIEPKFSLTSNKAYSVLEKLTLTSDTVGARIYFTIDGSDPNSSSINYTEELFPVRDFPGKPIKAIAIKEGMQNSPNVSAVFYYSILKTGQKNCYDTYAFGQEIDCNGTGRDGESQTGIERSYTDNGDQTITDNVTGLVWQKCMAGLSGNDCETGSALTYSLANATNYCTSSTLGGKTWKFPKAEELQTLLKYDSTNNGTTAKWETSVFPANGYGGVHIVNNLMKSENNGNLIWISFSTGLISGQSGQSVGAFRCVEDKLLIPAQSFTDNGDGTIKDNLHGLIWQKCYKDQDKNTCAGDPFGFITWDDAITYCKNLTLTGRRWRLPNKNELLSLVDYNSYNPAINSTYFPNVNNTNSATSNGKTHINNDWSSTEFSNGLYAYPVNFLNGGSGNGWIHIWRRDFSNGGGNYDYYGFRARCVTNAD